MKLPQLGRILFGACLVVFGLQNFFSGKWSGGLPPVPPWSPGPSFLVYAMGALLVAAGLSLIANKGARISATVVGLIFLLCSVFLHTQRFSGIIHDGVTRTRAFEAFAFAGAALVIAVLPGTAGLTPAFLSKVNPALAIMGRYIYAFSMVVFGVQHFLYAPYIAFLIPKWMPAHLFLAYFTGVAFIAAGLAIAAHILSRLASVLLGAMFLLWFVTLHMPRVIASPHNPDELTSAFVALGFAGASFALAAYSGKRAP